MTYETRNLVQQMAVQPPASFILGGHQDPCHLQLATHHLQSLPMATKNPTRKTTAWLVVEPTHVKHMLVKLDHFPR